MTLAESMAMAVLKGDMAAAYALAAKLIEQRESPSTPMEEAAKLIYERGNRVVHSSHVYMSEEFQGFCRRFGIAWDIRTVAMTITLPADGLMSVDQSYRAVSD